MYYDLTKAPHEQNIASRKCLGASLLSGRQRKQRIGRSTSDAPDPYVVRRYQSDWGRHSNRRKNPKTHNVAHPLPSRPTNLEFLGAGIRPSGRPDLYGLSKISAEAFGPSRRFHRREFSGPVEFSDRKHGCDSRLFVCDRKLLVH